MLTCPRCGFVQPEDRFCAQCGLDIQRYKPTNKPWLESLTSNTLVQLLIILGLVGSTTYVIYERKRASILPQLETVTEKMTGFVDSAPPKVQLRGAPTPNAAVKLSARPIEAKSLQNAVTASAVAPVENSEVTDDKAKGDETPGEAKVHLGGVRVVAIGMPKAQIPILVESAKVVGTSGETTGYWIKSWSNALQKVRDAHGEIVEFESGNVGFNGPNAVDWDRLIVDPGSNHEVGLSLTMTPNHPENSRFAVKFERSFRDSRQGASPEAQDTLSLVLDNLSVSQAGEALLLANVLPRRKLSPQEEMLFAPTFLRIMITPEFQSGFVSVGLLVEPQLQP